MCTVVVWLHALSLTSNGKNGSIFHFFFVIDMFWIQSDTSNNMSSNRRHRQRQLTRHPSHSSHKFASHTISTHNTHLAGRLDRVSFYRWHQHSLEPVIICVNELRKKEQQHARRIEAKDPSMNHEHVFQQTKYFFCFATINKMSSCCSVGWNVALNNAQVASAAMKSNNDWRIVGDRAQIKRKSNLPVLFRLLRWVSFFAGFDIVLRTSMTKIIVRWREKASTSAKKWKWHQCNNNMAAALFFVQRYRYSYTGKEVSLWKNWLRTEQIIQRMGATTTDVNDDSK